MRRQSRCQRGHTRRQRDTKTRRESSTSCRCPCTDEVEGKSRRAKGRPASRAIKSSAERPFLNDTARRWAKDGDEGDETTNTSAGREAPLNLDRLAYAAGLAAYAPVEPHYCRSCAEMMQRTRFMAFRTAVRPPRPIAPDRGRGSSGGFMPGRHRSEMRKLGGMKGWRRHRGGGMPSGSMGTLKKSGVASCFRFAHCSLAVPSLPMYASWCLRGQGRVILRAKCKPRRAGGAKELDAAASSDAGDLKRDM